MQKLQLTLAILKPHVVANPLAVQDIRNVMLSNRFNVIKWRKSRLKLFDAEKFYEEHKAKFFYNRLVTFMTRNDAIAEWRRLMGPTKVFKTQFEVPDSIRGTYGFSDTRNATHGSDSDMSAKREISIFFPDFNYEDWYKNEEKYFREGNVEFLSDLFLHKRKGCERNLVENQRL